MDLNDFVYFNDGTQGASFIFRLEESIGADGFRFLADGRIIGKTNILKDQTYTVLVSSYGRESTAMRLVFKVTERYYEGGDLEYGDADDVVEPLDKLPSVQEDDSYAAIVWVCVGVGCAIVVSVAGIVIFVRIRRRY